MDNNTETIELDLEPELLLKALLMAHDLDITFNQFVNDLLRSYIDQMESQNDANN